VRERAWRYYRHKKSKPLPFFLLIWIRQLKEADFTTKTYDKKRKAAKMDNQTVYLLIRPINTPGTMSDLPDNLENRLREQSKRHGARLSSG